MRWTSSGTWNSGITSRFRPATSLKGSKELYTQGIWQRHLDDQALQLRLYHDLYEAMTGNRLQVAVSVTSVQSLALLPSMTTINGTPPKISGPRLLHRQ